MITLDFNSFKSDINNYYKKIAEIDVLTIKCPNCGHHNMERHGYYKRYIIINGNKYSIRILRVRCKMCGHTHALLPDFIVPYLHLPITSLQQLITSDNNTSEDETIIKLIRKIKKKWEPVILSLGLNFKTKLSELVFLCSKAFRWCFMQIHRGKYYCRY